MLLDYYSKCTKDQILEQLAKDIWYLSTDYLKLQEDTVTTIEDTKKKYFLSTLEHSLLRFEVLLIILEKHNLGFDIKKSKSGLLGTIWISEHNYYKTLVDIDEFNNTSKRNQKLYGDKQINNSFGFSWSIVKK
jgi:hypothetical protein